MGMILKEEAVEGILKELEGGIALVGFEFALPDGECMPSHLGQLLLHTEVTFFVTGNLIGPELDIRFGDGIVFTALVSMPEAAVDEDAGAVFPHDDIGFTWQAGVVEAIAIAVAPQVFSHEEFRFRVFRPYGRHIPMALFGGHILAAKVDKKSAIFAE